MPDKYGFNHLTYHGRPYVACIEKDCKAIGFIPQWPEEDRKIHFLTHVYNTDSPNVVINGDKRTDKCRTCGNEFDQERKRGRPRVQCYVCKPDKED